MDMKNIDWKHFFSEVAALKFTPWYRWHPNVALRYLPVVERIRNLKRTVLSVRKGQSFTVLEVGSGGLGIAPYLKMPVTGVDKEFEPPFHPLLKRISGDATKLVFPNNSFDVVISMDMLEHLPKNKRRVTVLEMLRVAKKLVIIGVPCGKEAEKHDKDIAIVLLDSSARAKALARNNGGASGRSARDDEGVDKGIKFLEEQVEYGLPEEIDILHYIKAAGKELGKKIEVEIKGNMNLKLRKFLMRGWMSKNVLVNVVFRKLFLFLIPMFRLLDREPFYRKIFFVIIK